MLEGHSRLPHPVRLVVADDLHRSRLTVFFRLLLAIPHFLWAALIGMAFLVVVFIQWWVLLFRGRPAHGLHGFIAGYIRYTVHIEAYTLLAANPFPGFYPMSTAPYPVDLEFDPPAPQNRWKTLFRAFLALPAMIVSAALLSGGSRSGGGLALGAAFLLWWVGLIRGRSPRGLRDLVTYCIAYSAQLASYLFLVTDRYPYSGPNAYALPREDEEPHAVRMTVADDLRRSRLLVFFRLPIVIPHLVWLVLWSVVALLVVFLGWFCALVTGRMPQPFHRFVAAYLRYSTHVMAFLFLVGNPFPGFVGKAGSYPVELEIDPPAPQKRVAVLFRIFLALPAFLISSGLNGGLCVAGFLGWFVALFLGRMPDGLRGRIEVVLTDPASDLPALVQDECHDLLEQISEQTARIEAKTAKTRGLAGTNDTARRLQTMPGVDREDRLGDQRLRSAHGQLQARSRFCGLARPRAAPVHLWREGTPRAHLESWPDRYPISADHRGHVAPDSAGPKVDPGGVMTGARSAPQASHAGRHCTGQQDGTGHLGNDDKERRIIEIPAPSCFCIGLNIPVSRRHR